MAPYNNVLPGEQDPTRPRRPPNEFPRERPPNPGPVTRPGPTPGPTTPAPTTPAPTTPPLAAQQNALTEEQGTADYLKRMQERYGLSAEDLKDPATQQWVNKQNAKRRAEKAKEAAAATTPPVSTPETKPTEETTTTAPKKRPDDWWTREGPMPRYPGYPGGHPPGPWGQPGPVLPGGRRPEWGPPGTQGSPYPYPRLPSPTGPATANVTPPLTLQTQAINPDYRW